MQCVANENDESGMPIQLQFSSRSTFSHDAMHVSQYFSNTVVGENLRRNAAKSASTTRARQEG